MIHLARLSIRRPVASLVAWGVVAIALTLIGLGVTKSLSPSVTTVAGTQSSHAQSLANSRFGPSVLVPILLEGPKQSLDRQGPALVRALNTRTDTRTMSAWDGGSTAAALRPKPTAAMVVAGVAKTENQMVKTTQAQIDRTVRRVIHAPVRASISGQPTIDRAMKDQAIHTTRRSMAIAIPILFVVLLLLLRAPVVALALTALGAATAFSGLGIMALLGKVMDVDAVAVTSACMIGLALGVAYGLLFYRRWRAEVMADVAHHDAAHAATTAVETSGRAVLIAGLPLIVALLIAPQIADSKILISIGVGTLLVSLLAVGAAVVVMPAFLVLAARRTETLSFAAPAPALRGWERATGGGNWVIRNAVGAGAVATAALLALAIPLLSLDTGPPSVKYLPKNDSARVSFERIAKVMGAGYPTPYNIVVSSDTRPITDPALLHELDVYQANLSKNPAVAAVGGPGAFAATSKDLSVLPVQLGKSSKLIKSSKKNLLTLQRGLGQASAGVGTLRSGLSAAANGAGQLQSGSGSAQNGAGQLKAGLAQARAGATQISNGLSAALTGAIKLRNGASTALSGSKQITGGLGQAVQPVKAGAPIVKNMAADIATSSSAVKTASGTAQTLGGDLSQAAAAVAALPDSAGKTAALNAISSAQSSASGLSSSLSTTSSTLAGAAGVANAFSGQVSQLSSGLSQLYAGSSQLTSGIAQLQKGNSDLASGIGQLNGGGGQLTTGLAALENGAGQLQTGLGQLTGGAGQLATGLSAGVGPSGQLVTGLGGAATSVGKFRSSLPSTKDLERLQAQSPGLFNSGYFVLAAIAGASPTQQSQASFALNLTRGGNAAQITVIPKYSIEDARTQKLGATLQDTAKVFAKGTGTQVAVGGPAGSLADFKTDTLKKIAPVIVVTSVLVALILILMLRSVVLPLVAVAFDLLTAAATFGVVTLLFNGSDPVLGGPGYLDPMTIIAIFTVVFGMTMIYEVHLLVRTREAFVESGDAEGALRHGLRQTAAAGTGAAIAMLAVIIPFATTHLMTVRELGIGVAVAVLLDALIVRPVLLPAAVKVLGRRSWWWTSRSAPTPPAPAPSGGNGAQPLAPTTPVAGAGA